MPPTLAPPLTPWPECQSHPPRVLAVNEPTGPPERHVLARVAAEARRRRPAARWAVRSPRGPTVACARTCDELLAQLARRCFGHHGRMITCLSGRHHRIDQRRDEPWTSPFGWAGGRSDRLSGLGSPACCRGLARCRGGSRSTHLPARCCAITRSATRTNGRCGCRLSLI